MLTVVGKKPTTAFFKQCRIFCSEENQSCLGGYRHTLYQTGVGVGWVWWFFKFKDRSESIFKLEKGLVGVTSLTEILNQDLSYSNVMCRGVGV